jgi:hypothetical protein
MNDEGVARKRLRWVTVIQGEEPMNIHKEEETITLVTNEVQEMRKRLANMVRAAKASEHIWLFGGLWLNGAIHIELLDYEMFRHIEQAGKTTAKHQVMSSLLPAFDKKIIGKVFSVHFHSLVDIHDIGDEKVRELFTGRWDKHYKQVDITRLIENKPLNESLSDMSNYCYNRSNPELRYSRSWGTGEWEEDYGRYSQEVLDERVHQELSMGELRMLVEVHNRVGGSSHKGLSIRIQ